MPTKTKSRKPVAIPKQIDYLGQRKRTRADLKAKAKKDKEKKSREDGP